MSDLSFDPIHLAYGVMIVGVIFCFVLSRKENRKIREGVDKFAFAFVRLSNMLSPGKAVVELVVEEKEDGSLTVLPPEQQSKQVYLFLRRIKSRKAAELFAEMVNASEDIDRMAGINRTKKKQFAEPIRGLLYLTHDFLIGCENLSSINTVQKKERFESFINKQAEHRMLLLKRISGKKSNEYAEFNTAYAEEMKAMEKAEKEKRHRK